jgi:hypothetical protein
MIVTEIQRVHTQSQEPGLPEASVAIFSSALADFPQPFPQANGQVIWLR